MNSDNKALDKFRRLSSATVKDGRAPNARTMAKLLRQARKVKKSINPVKQAQKLNRVTAEFEKQLKQITERTHLSRKTLAETLSRINRDAGNHWEADLWQHTRSKDKLRQWVYLKLLLNEYDDGSLFGLASELPAWARRSLAEVVKALPPPHGGKPRALRFAQRARALAEFHALTEGRNGQRPISKNSAYRKLAKEMKVSEHTIRNICDPGEQKRQKEKGKAKNIALFELSQ